MTHIVINAHLLSRRKGYRSAGIHNVLHQLLLHLPQAAPSDWHFTALVGAQHPTPYPDITVQVAALNTEAPVKRILWEQAVQPISLLRQKVDLYHAGAFVAPVLRTTPMLVTVYDLTFMRYPQRLTRARHSYLRHFTAHTCRQARRIIAISESTKADLVDLLGMPAAKIDVTPLAYDRQQMRVLPSQAVAAFRQQQGLPERFWLYLGTLEPRKNLVTLIEAYARIPSAERLPLVLAGGKGWLAASIFEAIERHDLSESITLPGFIPTDDLALWYNSAECFIFPSVFEGFGLPVLEAMACGTPVITSDVSSLPEVVQDSGMRLPPDALDAWEAALKRAYYDADWRACSAARGLAIAETFSWSRTAQLTVNSYRQALEG